MPSALASLERATTTPSLLESTTTGRPSSRGLNTRSHEDYVRVKDEVVRNGRSPFELRHPGRGAGVFFEELCDAMRRRGVESVTCAQALGAYGCA